MNVNDYFPDCKARYAASATMETMAPHIDGINVREYDDTSILGIMGLLRNNVGLTSTNIRLHADTRIGAHGSDGIILHSMTCDGAEYYRVDVRDMIPLLKDVGNIVTDYWRGPVVTLSLIDGKTVCWSKDIYEFPFTDFPKEPLSLISSQYSDLRFQVKINAEEYKWVQIPEHWVIYGLRLYLDNLQRMALATQSIINSLEWNIRYVDGVCYSL
jgi:hypothetical protein